MVDWNYICVCVVIFAVQLVAINVVSVLLGLIAFVYIIVSSGVFAVKILVVVAVYDMSILFKPFVFVVALINICVLLIILLVAAGSVVAAWCVYFACMTSAITLLEVPVGVIIAMFKYLFDESPAIGSMKGRWEVVAVARSYNTCIETPQFRGAIVCDGNTTSNNSDPFDPEHRSVVHLVENRCRGILWKEVVVWRVSVLSGVQTLVDRKQFVALDGCYVQCFESCGVVFVIVQGSIRIRSWDLVSPTLLFIYDTANGGKSAQFELPHDMAIGRIASITCLQRMLNPDDDGMNGWRIRLLAFREYWNVHLAKYEMELHEGVDAPVNVTASTMSPEIFHGIFSIVKAVRTSDGMSGMYLDDDEESHDVLLYDPACNVFVYFADLEELSRFDKSFAAFDDHHDIIGERVWPIVLNDRECIVASNSGTIYRTEINPATLRYTAVKRMFRADPSLKSKINAAQFRQLTGIDRMDGHFES